MIMQICCWKIGVNSNCESRKKKQNCAGVCFKCSQKDVNTPQLKVSLCFLIKQCRLYFDHSQFLITFVLLVSKIMVETNLLVLSHCGQMFSSFWVIKGAKGIIPKVAILISSYSCNFKQMCKPWKGTVSLIMVWLKSISNRLLELKVKGWFRNAPFETIFQFCNNFLR